MMLVFAALVMLVAKEGSCRSTGRTVPALTSEDGKMPIEVPKTPKLPESPIPPKVLRQPQAPWELAELPISAQQMPVAVHQPREHDRELRRDRRFATESQQTVAQMPQLPEMPEIPQMHGVPSLPVPQMPDVSQMPQIPQLPSRRRR